MMKREAAIVSCYTDPPIGEIGEVYEYLAEITGYPVQTYQIPEVCRRYKFRIREDLVALKVED